MIVGLTGKSGSGKSTVAQIICNAFKGTEIAVADSLKKLCAPLFGISSIHFYDSVLKETIIEEFNATPRELMMTIGMFCRGLKNSIPNISIDNIWLHNMDKEVKKIQNEEGKEYNLIVISDIRFQDEYDWLKKNRGILIRIIRETESKSFKDHISETTMDGLKEDYVIYNSSTIEDLQDKVREIIKKNV